jgi:hypothetical protein
MSFNKQILSHALNADSASSPVDIEDASEFSIQMVFTGSPCTFASTVLVSSDPPGRPPANWDTLSGTDQSFSAASSFTYNIAGAGYNWIQLAIGSTSGSNTGIVTARVNVKGPGI